MAEPVCTHLDQIKIEPPPLTEVEGCEKCLKTGDRWLHLRICLTCGKIGCCDSSPNKHATAHHRESGHPIIHSMEPGEKWSYCYPDDVAFIVEMTDGEAGTGA